MAREPLWEMSRGLSGKVMFNACLGRSVSLSKAMRGWWEQGSGSVSPQRSWASGTGSAAAPARLAGKERAKHRFSWGSPAVVTQSLHQGLHVSQEGRKLGAAPAPCGGELVILGSPNHCRASPTDELGVPKEPWGHSFVEETPVPEEQVPGGPPGGAVPKVPLSFMEVFGGP